MVSQYPTAMCSILLYLQFLLCSPVLALPSSLSHAGVDKRTLVSKTLPIKVNISLPVAIGAVLAGYLGFTFLTIIAILTIGRRLRRSAQTSRRTLAMEMLKPNQTNANAVYEDDLGVSPAQSNPYGNTPTSTIDAKRDWPSPTAPGRSYTWGSLSKGHKKQPSVQSSVVTFDESVIEEDKSKNQIEMERLYAAVMEHDEKNSKSGPHVTVQPISQHPPELQHLRYASANKQATSPMDTNFPPRANTVSPRQPGSKLSRPSPISISGTTSLSRTSSTNSFGSPGKNRGVRNLPISPPMGSPDLDPDTMRRYGETEPLTPRHYNPGPPPTPPTCHTSNASNRQTQSPVSSPLRKNFPPSISTSRTLVSGPQSPVLPTPRSATNQVFKFPPSTAETDDTVPPSYPHWTPQTQTTPKSQRKPAHLAIRTNSETSTSASLPLRSATLPLRNINTSMSNRPPSMIKATVLERKVPDIQHLRTPMTGVPATPYSPYMPFTPLTPVTPRMLVGREERKRREREEGRRVLTAKDVVEEENSMWGDAY